jgi:tripartite-type tricarboxylate transporter receptor subunit TctC
MRVLRWIAALALAGSTALATAQSDPARYPEQGIKLVVVYQAGGANDIVARVLAERMTRTLGQTVMVINRPGASGALGAQAVATSAPDGYTVLMGGAPLVVARALYKTPPVDFETSLAPVGKAVNLNLVLVARKSLPADTFQQAIALERNKPGSTSMAVTASAYEFYHARINRLAGIDILKVPYPGVPAAMNDLNGDRVDLLIDTLAAQKPFLTSGATKPLAVFGRKRLAALPDVPTLAELGLKDFEDQPFVGMLVPRKTPESIVNKLNAALNEALADPQVKARMAALDMDVEGGTPQAFLAEMRRDAARFVEIGAQAGIPQQ